MGSTRHVQFQRFRRNPPPPASTAVAEAAAAVGREVASLRAEVSQLRSRPRRTCRRHPRPHRRRTPSNEEPSGRLADAACRATLPARAEYHETRSPAHKALAAVRQRAFVKAQSTIGRRIGSILLWFYRPNCRALEVRKHEARSIRFEIDDLRRLCSVLLGHWLGGRSSHRESCREPVFTETIFSWLPRRLLLDCFWSLAQCSMFFSWVKVFSNQALESRKFRTRSSCQILDRHSFVARLGYGVNRCRAVLVCPSFSPSREPNATPRIVR